jgi:hypothetical protein
MDLSNSILGGFFYLTMRERLFFFGLLVLITYFEPENIENRLDPLINTSS